MNRNILSLLAVFITSAVLVSYRFNFIESRAGKELKVTTWDAFGYYMYLPSIFIYNDYKELKWLPEIDQKYQLSGGQLYQANKHENGNYVFKYLGGVALLETPFFLIGHTIAKLSGFPADGFSAPYQYSIAFGAVLYAFLALLLLRRILLRYYNDRVTALTILLLVLATNLIQYVSVDGAQSHSFIFPLYVLILHATIKWHELPSRKYALLIGLTIGVAMISRPTEAIMLFIPLLWGTNTKEASKQKWRLVRENKLHILFAISGGILGILPQLIYWKSAAGSFIYDVGSKWFFLNPFFRVLVGFENGWFIYTPITLFFVAGFFFLKIYPFRKSVITFCLLNIWIIIAWSDWKYGATYSTRALVQSYPVFALAFAAVLTRIEESKWKYGFYAIGAYLIFVNLFQIDQYNDTILHYRDMNRKYYSHIYLNPHPSPLDMSLIDTDEFLNVGSEHKIVTLYKSMIKKPMNFDNTKVGEIVVIDRFDEKINSSKKEQWLRIDSKIMSTEGFHHSYLHCKLEGKNAKSKETRIRLFNPISKENALNSYSFYMKIPVNFKVDYLQLFLKTDGVFKGEVRTTKVSAFQ